MLLPLNCAFVCGRRESCGLLLIFEELGVSGLDASKALGNLNSAAMQCVYADTSECRCESVQVCVLLTSRAWALDRNVREAGPATSLPSWSPTFLKRGEPSLCY